VGFIVFAAVMMMMTGVFQFWSLLIILLDVFVIWALAVHGRKVAT
jgi:hypothetical protein